MGCGSVLGDLFYMADSVLQSTLPSTHAIPRQGIPERAKSDDEVLRFQLYDMYGEGRINEQVFNALRSLADRGQLRQVDLAVHQARANRPPKREDQEVSNAQRGIRSRLSQLADARRDSERVLSDLEARISGFAERLVTKETDARIAVSSGDEQTARLRLAERARLSDSHERLLAQAGALRNDLTRLADLQAQLEAKSAELEAVCTRGKLAELGTTQNELEVET